MPAGAAGADRTSTPVLPRRAKVLAAAAVFVALLMVYCATLIRTVVDQDSGELVAACHVLGIAHPTGYPLWVVLGRAFDFLPVGGTSAYRVALLSAVSTAGAGALVTWLALGLTGQVIPAALAGLSLGLWYPAWSQAVRAEVYGLSVLLVALALVALLKWEERRASRALVWLSLASGFVFMHHRTALAVVAPALCAAWLLTRPRRARMYVAAGAAFLAPFVLYAYLPIRAAARPAVNWTDPSTWQRFWDHVTASQYQGYALANTLGLMMEEARKLLPQVLVPNAAWAVVLALIGVPLIAWGWHRWMLRQRTTAISLAAGSALLCFWVLRWGETTDLKVFLGPLGMVLALCGAVAVAGLPERLPRTAQVRAVPLMAALLAFAIVGGGSRARSDLSDMWKHRDRWVAMLSELEQNAVFISDNDVPSFATMYLQTVEQMRPDVTLLRVVPLQTDWYVDLIEDDELREATRGAWQGTMEEMASRRTLDTMTWKWERAAVFAHLLARRMEGKRPVYVLHGPRQLMPEEPPYFVGISEDLVQLRFARPELEREWDGTAVVARFAAGIQLASFQLDRAEAATGELVDFRTQWRLAGPPPPAHFSIRLAPEDMSSEDFVRGPWASGRFVQGFPLLHWPAAATPSADGTVYEQGGRLIVPTNAQAGEYRVSIALGPPYADESEEWVERVDWFDVAGMTVRAGPRPTNGP
jgi:hypothetical protein